jgi:predicted esterase
LVHGKADQVVLPRFGSELRDRLVKQNLAAKLVTHDGGHGLGPRMDDVRDFILGALKKGGNNQ